MNKGYVYAIIAYGSWGFLPIYLKLLKEIPAVEILAHRMVWSFIFLLVLLAFKRDWAWVAPAVRDKKLLFTYFSAVLLLSVNWGLYIWSTNTNHLADASLGYFINPLVNVMLGVIFLRETMRPGQWVAVVIAAVGVIYLTINYGSLPWIALMLAGTFGTYGLLKKTASLDSLRSLSLETSMVFVPALAYLGYLEFNGQAAFGHISWTNTFLLSLAGVVTATPLLFFAGAVQRVPLSILGIFQYLAPTFQFLLAVFLYEEPFTPARFFGFCIIWLALLVFTAENFWQRRTAGKLTYAKG